MYTIVLTKVTRNKDIYIYLITAKSITRFDCIQSHQVEDKDETGYLSEAIYYLHVISWSNFV
jgi:hypothetical protein